jgi:hypothetical protein
MLLLQNDVIFSVTQSESGDHEAAIACEIMQPADMTEQKTSQRKRDRIARVRRVALAVPRTKEHSNFNQHAAEQSIQNKRTWAASHD